MAVANPGARTQGHGTQRRTMTTIPSPGVNIEPDATLTERQVRAATLEAMGHTTAEIAATIDVHRATVFRWRKGKSYRSRVASISQDSQRVARTTLQAAARQAAKTLEALMSSEDPNVALRASLAVLDRTGHGPAQRIELASVENYPTDAAEDLVEGLRKVLAGIDTVAW